MWEILSFLE